MMQELAVLDPGQTARKPTVETKVVSVDGRWLRIARLSDEWYVDVDDPEAQAALIKATNEADLFTFLQRPPDTEPRHRYFMDVEPTAVLRVTTYENWLRHQINNKTRNLVMKAQKKGVVVKAASFDDAFIDGMVRILNETPVRQGKPFWHYGKDHDTVKREFARYLFREELAGAYYANELIGFIFLADAGRFAVLGQIISLIRHRDKAPNNALIAKAVDMCAKRRIPYLTYAVWPRGPLQDFKRHNGFERVDVPRYYIPLTGKGRLALKLGLHRALSDRLSDGAFMWMINVRSKFYQWRSANSIR